MAAYPELCLPAGLIADRARASMLLALDASPVLSATDLALMAGVSKSTASEHLRRLIEGGLVSVERRSRMTFYRLSGAHVARALAALNVLVPSGDGQRSGPIVDASDHIARTCYDHLAGRLGVALFDALLRRRYLSRGEAGRFRVTVPGATFFRNFGLDLRRPASARRPAGRACLDRTERQPHLAGHVGAQLAGRCIELEWVQRIPGTRTLRITPAGRRGLKATFGVEA